MTGSESGNFEQICTFDNAEDNTEGERDVSQNSQRITSKTLRDVLSKSSRIQAFSRKIILLFRTTVNFPEHCSCTYL